RWIAPGRWSLAYSLSSRTSISANFSPRSSRAFTSSAVVSRTRDFASFTSARKRGECCGAMTRLPSRRFDVPVQDALEHLLPPRDVLLRVALLQHVPLQLLEAGFARLDLGADAAVPGGVAPLDEVAHYPVGTHPGRDLQPLGKGVHAADVRVEEVHRLEAL